MMKCKKCNHQFKYLESINTGLIPKIGVKCPKCKTQLYYTAKSRKQSTYIYIHHAYNCLFINYV